MWTIFRFALSGADGRAYDDAYAILKGAGFVRTRGAYDGCEPFPAAVVGYVRQDPAVVTRSIFEALGEARLRPVGVTGVPVAHPPAVAPRQGACA